MVMVGMVQRVLKAFLLMLWLQTQRKKICSQIERYCECDLYCGATRCRKYQMTKENKIRIGRSKASAIPEKKVQKHTHTERERRDDTYRDKKLASGRPCVGLMQQIEVVDGSDLNVCASKKSKKGWGMRDGIRAKNLRAEETEQRSEKD